MEDCGYYLSRQHLNLSRSAFDTVESDKLIFMERPSLSGMLNIIFAACCTDSDAAVDTAVERFADELESRLSSVHDTEAKSEIIKALCACERERLIKKVNGYGKDCPFKFQLSRDNFEFMQCWHDENDCYRGSAGAFIKAVIEEYAAMPFYKREEAILKDRISLLESFIDSGRLISVTTGGTRYEVRPYCLCTDMGKCFHYLVGLSRKANSKDEELPASFRLSRIQKLSQSSSRSGRITAAQQKRIEERIKSVGVQFMLQSPETVTVKLTAVGMRMYETQTHLRPACIRKEPFGDGFMCEFLCAPIQADFYFFKFGAEAEIISPPELRRSFCKRYSEAFNKYNTEGNL